MDAEIISVGDELLTGLTVNTNAAVIGEALVYSGHPVRWITTVGDDEADLIRAFEQAFTRSRLVVMTGGIGPTHDDITKKTAARFFESDLVFRKDILERLQAFFQRRGRTMSSSNASQAWVPEKAELLDNDAGTAPGFLFRRGNALCFILPGVPAEAERMMRGEVLPRLMAADPGQTFRSRLLRTVGIPESELYDRIFDFPERFPQIKLAFLPQPSGLTLRLVAWGRNAADCDSLIESGERFIREKAGEWIYGVDGDTLEKAVAERLLAQGKILSVAESCTGGLVANKLTNISGSSTFFERGVVAYSNASKVQLLGVSMDRLSRFGAVSAETAAAMAEGIRRTSESDIGLSTTGIAGPGGGSDQRPVGLLYVGYSDAGRT
ncbi:MAG TPA: competence/damage-inducible protein A, partial [bacterium]